MRISTVFRGFGRPDNYWGDDEAALLRLWREKRGEIVGLNLGQPHRPGLGSATEELNGGHWYGLNSGRVVADIQKRVLASGVVLDGSHSRRSGGVQQEH